jgi:hypothetical protein
MILLVSKIESICLVSPWRSFGNDLHLRETAQSCRWKTSLALCSIACLLGFGLAAQAQKTITFDAPGADTPPGDYNGTYPSGINALGVIAGSYQGADTVYHGFVRRPDGHFTTFEAPGADTTAGSYNGTSPSSINDLGVITGSFSDASGLSHGFLRTPDGRFTTFDVPGAGENGTFPIGINLEGAVVGYALDSNDLFHAFLRTSYGKIYTFVGPGSCDTGTSTGCYGSAMTAINIWGISVGGFMDNSGNFVVRGLIRYLDGALQTFEVPGAGTGTGQGTGCPGCASGLNQWGRSQEPTLTATTCTTASYAVPRTNSRRSMLRALVLEVTPAPAVPPIVLQASTTSGPSWEPILTRTSYTTVIYALPMARL